MYRTSTLLSGEKDKLGMPFGQFGETGFPLPPDTRLLAHTFAGNGLIRSDDISRHPAYGTAVSGGSSEEQLSIRSYLAAPIQARSGEVLGGLFFGHPDVGVFSERHERIVAGIAAQAAIAIDNARLFSEMQRAQNALQFTNEHLQRANTDLEQFAYSASHDLQEPIRNMAIYSEILDKQYSSALDESARACLKVVIEGAHRMEMLVHDLLAYVRITGADDKPVPMVDANRVFSVALANLWETIRESGAQITCGSLPEVCMHEVHLQQIFQNLVGNGIKYRSTARPEVNVWSEKVEHAWQFAVEDNGIGISPQHKEKIFGIFKRLHTASEYTGTGMGLAICKRLVERYSGQIWVQSEPGKGSTFFFTIPDRKPAAD